MNIPSHDYPEIINSVESSEYLEDRDAYFANDLDKLEPAIILPSSVIIFNPANYDEN